jgi:hypothetical protein
VVRDQVALLPRLVRTFKPGALDIFGQRTEVYFRKTPLCRSHRMVIRTVSETF